MEIYFLAVSGAGSPRAMKSVGRFGFSEASLLGLQIHGLSSVCAPIPVSSCVQIPSSDKGTSWIG